MIKGPGLYILMPNFPSSFFDPEGRGCFRDVSARASDASVQRLRALDGTLVADSTMKA